MPIVPDTRLGKLQFYETHLVPWTEHTAAIGLDADGVAALTARADATREAYAAFRAAQSTARAAAQRYFNLVAELHGAPGAGSDMLETIKNFAQSTADPAVYTLAEIPPPATPATRGSAPPPGTPEHFAVTLSQDGTVRLRWECKNPPGTRGTIYEVSRREDRGPMVFLGTTGTKRFTDGTIPANAGPLEYRVTALRSTRRGRPGVFSLRFGGRVGDGNTQNGTSGKTGGGGTRLAA